MCISVQNHNTWAGIGKFIYNALTLRNKQLLLKCDNYSVRLQETLYSAVLMCAIN